MDDRTLKVTRHIICTDIRDIVEFMIAHHCDPFRYAEAKTRHGTKACGYGRDETNDRKKTEPIEEESDDTREIVKEGNAWIDRRMEWTYKAMRNVQSVPMSMCEPDANQAAMAAWFWWRED